MSGRLRRVVFRVALGAGLLAVAGVIAQAALIWPKVPVRRALLEAIRPVKLTNCTLERFGHPNDGGYVMCANLLDNAKVAYSYGIEGRDEWGCDISRQYHLAVHEYDCFDPRHPVCEGGELIFHPECIGVNTEVIEGRSFDSFMSQLARNGDQGKNVVAKIDVEGAEWDSLLATPDDVLDRIEQLSIELHGTSDPKFVAVIKKLKKTFLVANTHVNNFSCGVTPWPFPGWAYELLFVNKRLGIADPDAKSAAPLDALNTINRPGHRDCQIDWK